MIILIPFFKFPLTFFFNNKMEPKILEVPIIITPLYTTTCWMDQKNSGSRKACDAASHIPPDSSNIVPKTARVETNNKTTLFLEKREAENLWIKLLETRKDIFYLERLLVFNIEN